MQDLSTGPFRQLSPPCSQYGRTAGFPWESVEICISLMCWLMTLLLITAVMLASPIRMSFSRRCLWLLRCLQVSNLMIKIIIISANCHIPVHFFSMLNIWCYFTNFIFHMLKHVISVWFCFIQLCFLFWVNQVCLVLLHGQTIYGSE